MKQLDHDLPGYLLQSPTSEAMTKAAQRIRELEQQGPVPRTLAKRQIAATRAFVSLLRTRATSSSKAPIDHQQLNDALHRLETETEALARHVYTSS